MNDRYSLCSRNGLLRMDSDGETVTFVTFPDTPGSPLQTGSVTMSISDLRQVIGRVFEVSDEHLSNRDLQRIGNEVERRFLNILEQIVEGNTR